MLLENCVGVLHTVGPSKVVDVEGEKASDVDLIDDRLYCNVDSITKQVKHWPSVMMHFESSNIFSNELPMQV